MGTNTAFQDIHGCFGNPRKPAIWRVFLCIDFAAGQVEPGTGWPWVPMPQSHMQAADGLGSIRRWLRRGSHGEFACKRLTRTLRFDAVCSCLQGCCAVTRPNMINRTMRPHQPETLFPGAPRVGRAERTSLPEVGSLRIYPNTPDDPCCWRGLKEFRHPWFKAQWKLCRCAIDVRLVAAGWYAPLRRRGSRTLGEFADSLYPLPDGTLKVNATS